MLYLGACPYLLAWILNTDTRSRARYRAALFSSAANLVAKGLAFLLFAVAIRRASVYLDPDSLGLWLAVSGFATALGFLDLGMGNAMTNRVAAARATGSAEELARVVTGGIVALLLLGIATALALGLLATAVDLSARFHIHQAQASAALRPTLVVFAGCFGLSLAANAVVRVLVALQEGVVAYGALAVVNGAALAWLLSPLCQQPSIQLLLLLCYGLPALAGLVLLPWLRQRGLLPWRTAWGCLRAEVPSLARPAGLYFLLQLGTMVAGGADGLLISTTLGVREIAAFAAVQKLFQLIQVPLGTLNTPLWAAYADATALGERHFVRITLVRSLAVTAALVIAAGSVFCFLGAWAIGLWTHGQVTVPLSLLLAYLLFALVDALGNCFGVFLNGVGILRPQLAALIPMLVAGISVKLWLLADHGVAAMLIGYTLVYLVIVGAVYGIVNRRVVLEHLT